LSSQLSSAEGASTAGTGAGPLLCLIPRHLAARMERTMERYGEQHDVQVIVDRRRGDRRGDADRREHAWPGDDAAQPSDERRRLRNADGRRVGERRATLIPVDAPAALPRRAKIAEAEIAFAERLDPGDEYREDLDTARLILRCQAGDRDCFAKFYVRYFDRVFAYMRLALSDSHEAEDLTQQVFLKALESLDTYELRATPVRAWLFRIVRNHAINHVTKQRRFEVEDPAEIDRRRELTEEPLDPSMLDWLSDSELLLLIERLPPAQRQVMMLRYMMDLSYAEVAEVLGRSPDAVRQLQQRALRYLRARLKALGHPSYQRTVRVSMLRLLSRSPVLRARRYSTT
jgi:RNA polymerase sigma-70 factor (ECF subfamily)